MLGTAVNCIGIIAGGLLGTFFGNKISSRFSDSIMKIMGFIVACIGIQGAAGAKSILVVVLSMVIGTVIGMFLKLDRRINDAGDWAKGKLERSPLGKGPFSEAFVTSSMLFSIGTMAILGSIRAGLDKDYSILFTKTMMDFISAIAFSSALGAGVIFSFIPVLILQGTVTLLAGAAEPVLTAEVINEMSGVGGPIFLAMSVNMLELKQERFCIGDMLPAIFLPIIFVPIVNALGLM